MAQESVSVVFLGDSNTWLSGDNCDKEDGWTCWFKRAFYPGEYRSYARSGATWTHTSATTRDTKENIAVISDNNVISNQVYRLIEDTSNGSFPVPQLIMISCGTNDVWFADKRPYALGSASESDGCLTLKDAVMYNCNLIKSAYPQVEVVLLTPMFSTKTNNMDIINAGDIISETAYAAGIHVIRQDNNDFIDPDIERRSFRFSKDGVHTSRPGARRNGIRIADKTKSMIKLKVER